MKDSRLTLPGSFINAEWSGTTPDGRIVERQGICFRLESGEILRLGISPESVRHVVETLQHYLHRDHSDKSSDIPSLDVSCPPRGGNV